MGRLGFYFDPQFCIGCKACQIACKDRHDLWEGQFFRRVVTFRSGIGPGGLSRLLNYSGTCNHCYKPACIPVCPSAALYKRQDGTVGLNSEKCTGCGECAKTCPYDAVVFDQSRSRAAKCDSCIDLRVKGQNPVCVDACVSRCLEFGDLEELKKIHGSDLIQKLPFLPDSKLTEPSLLIKAVNFDV